MIAPTTAKAQRIVATRPTSNDSRADCSSEEGIACFLVPFAARRLVCYFPYKDLTAMSPRRLEGTRCRYPLGVKSHAMGLGELRTRAAKQGGGVELFGHQGCLPYCTIKVHSMSYGDNLVFSMSL
jgi:hypothetical protein